MAEDYLPSNGVYPVSLDGSRQIFSVSLKEHFFTFIFLSGLFRLHTWSRNFIIRFFPDSRNLGLADVPCSTVTKLNNTINKLLILSYSCCT